MVSFNYNHNSAHVDARFIGDVSQSEIINFIYDLRVCETYPCDLNILIDATDGALSIKPNQLYRIFEENAKMFGKYSSLRVALVMKRPLDTALALIYTKISNMEDYKYQVFSTRSAALVWLHNGCQNDKYKIGSNGPRPNVAR